MSLGKPPGTQLSGDGPLGTGTGILLSCKKGRHPGTRMSLENIVPSDVSQSQGQTLWGPTYRMSPEQSEAETEREGGHQELGYGWEPVPIGDRVTALEMVAIVHSHVSALCP